MSVIKFFKVIHQLPSVLEPNSVYVVRTGSGFKLYVTDNTGNFAFEVISFDSDKVDGFHASKTPSPNTIPVAGPDGKLASGWIDLPSGSVDWKTLYARMFFFGGD